mmetsp:Transcript_22876/g.70307  ORF Transcript_22876/g.70307 Transcript_22876/m.70307 type:complete len:143 (+) Transcript_22876:112-540(+)
MPLCWMSWSWLPCSATRPSLMTAMRSEAMTVERRCATKTTVEVPFEMSASRDCWTANWDSSSNDDVASSRRQILGERRKTRAMAMRCRWPPENRKPRSPTRVSKPSLMAWMKSSAKALRAASRTSRAGTTSLSSAARSSSRP